MLNISENSTIGYAEFTKEIEKANERYCYTEAEIMVTDKQILAEIHRLPESLKQEVLHYINFLKTQQARETASKTTKKRQFGSAKGKYKLAPDFNAPR